MRYPVSYRRNSSPQQRSAAARVFTGAQPRPAAAATAGALPANYGERWLHRPFRMPAPNARVPLLSWVSAFFSAHRIGVELGNLLYDFFKPRMVASLMVDFGYTQTSDCGIAWDYMSDVYDYPACGPSFVVPASPVGLSTPRPAAVTMWGKITGIFAGNPERQGSQKWIRTMAIGPAITGFMPRAISPPRKYENVAPLVYPGVFSWAEPTPLPFIFVPYLVPSENDARGYAPPIRRTPRVVTHEQFILAPGIVAGHVSGRTRTIVGALPQVRAAPQTYEKKVLASSRSGRAIIATLRTLGWMGDFNGAVKALHGSLPAWARTPGAGTYRQFLDIIYNFDRIRLDAALARSFTWAVQQRAQGIMEGMRLSAATGYFGESTGWWVARGASSALGGERRLARAVRSHENDTRY